MNRSFDVEASATAHGAGLCVRAPARLHFGLLSFGRGHGRQFGGAGLMLETPATEVEFRPEGEPRFAGWHAERAREFAERWADFYHVELPACCLVVRSAPPLHVGLGAGTQLALAVAAGLHAWHDEPRPPPAQLARSVGRGKRSAVGIHGFFEGGLIIERGKLPYEDISPLDCRLDLPAAWRIVLLRPRAQQGIFGEQEQSVFDALPAVPDALTRAMSRTLREELVPAAARGDFERFSESIYRYGRRAGQAFAAVQGGLYNGPLLTDVVARIRQLGVAGVSQTSWGPTLFALFPDELSATAFVSQMRDAMPEADLEFHIAAVANHGATIEPINSRMGTSAS